MLEYRFHELRLGSRYYILLPKVNSLQIGLLERRLTSKGLSVVPVGTSRPPGSGAAVHLDAGGLCWASFEIADAVAPVVPDVLSAPAEPLPMSELMAMYFASSRSGSRWVVHLKTRVESGSAWDRLRESGECALTPDEHAVACSILLSSRGPCGLLTDFPVEGSRVRLIGRRPYYESNLSPEEAAETLRVIGKKGSRNSYLPRNGILSLGSSKPSSQGVNLGLLENLGEWCYFRPAQRKRSN